MHSTRLRHAIAIHCLWWCLAGIVLTILQPFIFTHFRQDGWEDEPGFRVRNVEARALFVSDEREDHLHETETTLYVPTAAHLDVPDAFEQGLDRLMALVHMLLPFAVAVMLFIVPAWRAAIEHVSYMSGAPPPPASPWHTQPPKAAPPLTT